MAPVKFVPKKFLEEVRAKALSVQVQANLVLDGEVSVFVVRVALRVQACAVLAATAWTWLAAELDDLPWRRLRVQAKTAHCSQPVALTG
jgi:hypothetical protein